MTKNENQKRNIVLFGENCTGKSTVADALKESLDYSVVSGKDYLRLAKNPGLAKDQFVDQLSDESSNIIFVTAEKDQLDFVPESVIRILFKTELDVKKERFSARFNGQLPPPVEKMLERKDGMFDKEKHDLVFENYDDVDQVVTEIISFVNQ